MRSTRCCSTRSAATAGARASTPISPSRSGTKRTACARWCRSRRPIPASRMKRCARSTRSCARRRVEKFGPVRSVTPTLVFEIGFEGIQASPRHKSGIAVRFPRMLRWRTDKRIEDADTLAMLKGFPRRVGAMSAAGRCESHRPPRAPRRASAENARGASPRRCRGRVVSPRAARHRRRTGKPPLRRAPENRGSPIKAGSRSISSAKCGERSRTDRAACSTRRPAPAKPGRSGSARSRRSRKAAPAPLPAPLTVLWITPMRALAADTARALQSAVDRARRAVDASACAPATRRPPNARGRTAACRRRSSRRPRASR